MSRFVLPVAIEKIPVSAHWREVLAHLFPGL